jgi:hypothetical protein
MSELVPIGRLSLREAQESPCMTCASSPCCTHVPLHTFQVRTFRDLDHAIYLLNFERIVLGLAPNGDWSVYYKHPCRFLDRTDASNALCTIHGSDMQPRICVNYSPYTCWYRQALTPGVSAGFLTIDRRRLELILEQVRFDDARNVVETPDWPALMELCASIPLSPEPLEPSADGPGPDPVFEQWLEDAAAGLVPPPRRRRGYADFLDPCTGCGAWCCKTLVFPFRRPAARRNLDYLQFMLGFPGIEVGVSDGDWTIAVRTRCRHLTADNRCGVYGQPERPSLCRYFDATGCSYVSQFGAPRPPGFLRIRLEQFFWLVEAIGFDGDGAIVELPPTEQLREVVEERWRQAVYMAAGELGADAAAALVTTIHDDVPEHAGRSE